MGGTFRNAYFQGGDEKGGRGLRKWLSKLCFFSIYFTEILDI